MIENSPSTLSPENLPFRPRKDITGRVFTRLTALKCCGFTRSRNAVWLCRCTCGTFKEVASGELLKGTTMSCGCLVRELIDRRKMNSVKRKYAKEYRTWHGMKSRCLNPRCKEFPDYGGRGITVCDRWKHSFKNFIEDMGKCPSPELQIDRTDNDKGYEPGNCKWRSVIAQANNRRNNHLLEFNGRTQTLTQWAREFGIRADTLRWRLRLGFSLERLMKPVAAMALTFNGKTMTLREWSEETGIKLATIIKRMKDGYSVEQILYPGLFTRNSRFAIKPEEKCVSVTA